MTSSRLKDEWLNDINSGKVIGSVFVDLKKLLTFDNHETLLHKLKLHNFSEKSLSLFKSYLSEKTQCIKHKNMYSSPQTLASRVPQGSILGPIFFLIYINDLSLFIKNSNLDLYADDSTWYTYGAKSLEVQTNLQSSLNSILDWCTYNNMFVNPTKTKCMLIGPKSKSTSCKLELRINNVPIENVESHKILGVHIDKHLSWAVHIDKNA